MCHAEQAVHDRARERGVRPDARALRALALRPVAQQAGIAGAVVAALADDVADFPQPVLEVDADIFGDLSEHRG